MIIRQGFVNRSALSRWIILSVGVTLLWAVAPIAISAPVGAEDLQVYDFSFEDGFEGWEIDGDMPVFPCEYPQAGYPECPTKQPIERLWLIRRSAEQALDGTYSLKVTIDGGGDDGTAWIVRAFPVAPNTRYVLRLDLHLGLLQESPINAWSVVAYAGTRRPRVETAFTTIGNTGQGTGWVPFTYITEVQTGDVEALWVACGIRVNWETWRTHYLDTIRVTLSVPR